MSAGEIRRAIAAGDYQGAAALFDSYAQTLPQTEGGIAELAELLQWTRTTVLCAHAHAQGELASLRAAAAYSR